MKISRGSAFFLGLLCGVLIAALAVGVAGYIALEEGLTVEVETTEIAVMVRTQVEDHARQELPRVIAQLKETMPQGVAYRLSQSLRSATISLYGTDIHLPEQAIAELEGNLRGMVLREIDKSFAKLDSEQLVDEWGAQAEESVRTLLARELDGKTFVVRPYKWLSVPVTVTTSR